MIEAIYDAARKDSGFSWIKVRGRSIGEKLIPEPGRRGDGVEGAKPGLH
jgi:hypothetical protein